MSSAERIVAVFDGCVGNGDVESVVLFSCGGCKDVDSSMLISGPDGS
jgi:hypothetical protein